VIAFIGSVFSPYYHWSGRHRPENHVAFNVALYGRETSAWAMTERGHANLSQGKSFIQIGPSRLSYLDDGIDIDFNEMALPWPGHRLRPKRIRGRIRLRSQAFHDTSFVLDRPGAHAWWPVLPRARATVECDILPGGGWQGTAYHDQNFGARPLETDFLGWDWARGEGPDDSALVLYDAVMRNGDRSTLSLSFADGVVSDLEVPSSKPLPRGGWGVKGGISCDTDQQPVRLARYEDTPFYTRSKIRTSLKGQSVDLMHETLDCRRLANPVVRMMLPFRMPRRAGG